MVIKAKLGRSEDRAYLEKISNLASDLRSISDASHFVQQMVSLSALLSSYDSSLGGSYPAIDENAQDPTYFLIAYFDTQNVPCALSVYRIVRSLTRHVLLLDKFYETKNDRYAMQAKQARKSAFELARSEGNIQHLVYSMDYSLKQFSEFWKFEQITKRRILEKGTFSYPEIRHFILSKSSDASLVYAKILDAVLPGFSENATSVLHYNQALLDIQDDWEDIEEDVREDMPNIFVMAALAKVPYTRIRKSRRDLIRKVVLSGIRSSQEQPISRLATELHQLIEGTSIPGNFSFLKILSDRYVDSLKMRIPIPQ